MYSARMKDFGGCLVSVMRVISFVFSFQYRAQMCIKLKNTLNQKEKHIKYSANDRNVHDPEKGSLIVNGKWRKQEKKTITIERMKCG